MKTLHPVIMLFVLTLFNIGLSNQTTYAENQNPPVIITQVELGSSLVLLPDNQSCTSPPDPKMTNNCLTDLVPGHNVTCSYFLGNRICEPLHHWTSGTNQSCLEGFPSASAPQWFDMYNTSDMTVDLQNFTAFNKLNFKPYGSMGPFSTILELRPHEKCTFLWLPMDQALSMGLNNVSMAISYNYDGKKYDVSTPSFSDVYNDTRTWQFEENKWIFTQNEPGPIMGYSNYANSSLTTPLKQFESGITANDVKCEQGLQLVIKAKDSSPACVKLDSAYMLIKRGWATSESAYPGGDAQFALDTNSTIIPAHLPRSSGLRIPYDQPSRVINYIGFDGVYNETFQFRGTQNDYVLKPGSTGVITFKLEAVSTEQQGQDYPIPLPKSLNLTNYAVFYHEITSINELVKYPGVTFNGEGYGDFSACSKGPAGGGTCIGGQFGGTNPIEAFVTDHPGVDVLFEPPSEVLPLGMNATSQVVTMMITVDSNAPRGTYLVQLPSLDLDSFLLTVGNQPYHE